MAKNDQSPLFKLPDGKVHTLVPNGGNVVGDYGKRPVSDTYNPDHGSQTPRDPQRGRKEQ